MQGKQRQALWGVVRGLQSTSVPLAVATAVWQLLQLSVSVLCWHNSILGLLVAVAHHTSWSFRGFGSSPLKLLGMQVLRIGAKALVLALIQTVPPACYKCSFCNMPTFSPRFACMPLLAMGLRTEHCIIWGSVCVCLRGGSVESGERLLRQLSICRIVLVKGRAGLYGRSGFAQWIQRLAQLARPFACYRGVPTKRVPVSTFLFLPL